MGVEGAFFWVWFNVHTFNCYSEANRAESLRLRAYASNRGIHGGFMADSWRIHGGFMADNRFGYEKWLQEGSMGLALL